jgi:hypothetical protein
MYIILTQFSGSKTWMISEFLYRKQDAITAVEAARARGRKCKCMYVPDATLVFGEPR